MNNSNAQARKAFKYNTKIIGSTPDDSNALDGKFVVPSKYLSKLSSCIFD